MLYQWIGKQKQNQIRTICHQNQSTFTTTNFSPSKAGSTWKGTCSKVKWHLIKESILPIFVKIYQGSDEKNAKNRISHSKINTSRKVHLKESFRWITNDKKTLWAPITKIPQKGKDLPEKPKIVDREDKINMQGPICSIKYYH